MAHSVIAQRSAHLKCSPLSGGNLKLMNARDKSKDGLVLEC
jgi:hypothetical protein